MSRFTYEGVILYCNRKISILIAGKSKKRPAISDKPLAHIIIHVPFFERHQSGYETQLLAFRFF